MDSDRRCPLPLIVGFGGYNAAGRSSFHHGYCRTVWESLDSETQNSTLLGLAVMMGLVTYQEGHWLANDESQLHSADEVVARYQATILANTLIRDIDPDTYFDPKAVPFQQFVTITPSHEAKHLAFSLPVKQLPNPVPSDWEIVSQDDHQCEIRVHALDKIAMTSLRDIGVSVAGQLPKGFTPGAYYKGSHHHPKGLQLSILAASDAVNSIGLDWDTISGAVSPDQIAVYASSVMSQLDEQGLGGMIKARQVGQRVTTKQLALGLNTMPADFVNAYVLGNLGMTSAITGACASFLYNLQAATEDIRSGRRRVVVVGCSEAPITSEVIDGYATMSALATNDGLAKTQGKDWQSHRASRPFGENCGFVIAESAQFVVLMDDALAVELGAPIHGAVTDVFINADGPKKSISAPGAGNYITFAKAVASAIDDFGLERVKHRSLIHAHGSSTPKNRTTESDIFSRVAQVHGIEDWPVTAVKAFVGHSLGPASGDQLMSALGTFEYGWLPGLSTLDAIAGDVAQQGLSFSIEDTYRPDRDIAFLNSKGFGGNNATGVVISSALATEMVKQRHFTKNDGAEAYQAFEQKQQQAVEIARKYDEACQQGEYSVIYRFGEGLIDESAIDIRKTHLRLSDDTLPIALSSLSHYREDLPS